MEPDEPFPRGLDGTFLNSGEIVRNRGIRYDAKSGTFDNEKANGLTKDTYRRGYEIPDQV